MLFPPLNEQEVELAAASLSPYPQALHLLPGGQHKGRCLCPEDTIVPLGTSVRCAWVGSMQKLEFTGCPVMFPPFTLILESIPNPSSEVTFRWVTHD